VNGALPAATPPRANPLALFDPSLLIALALAVGVGVGAVFAHKLTLGMAALIALAYGALVMLNLPLALILYVPLTFLQTVKFPGVGPAAIGLVILAGWLASSRCSFVGVREFLSRHARLLSAIAALLIWNAATIAWAPSRSVAGASFGDWTRAALLFFLLVTTMRTVKDTRMLMGALIVGSLLAILAGATAGGWQTAQKYDGRLTGGAGDPNYLAMELVVATILALALVGTTHRRWVRIPLVLALPVLAYGFAATESRGGLLAAACATFAALLLFRNKRLAILSVAAGVVVLAAVWSALNPTELARITSFSSGGDGRSDLWTVAWRVWHGHPIAGVGLGNFIDVAGQYVNRPGALTSVALIVTHPHVVHNVYLEALVDTGVIGLILLVAVFTGFLGTAVRAGRVADVRGQPEVAILARAVAVAIVAAFIAMIFLSDGPDPRMWALYALAPITLRLAYIERSRRLETSSAAGNPSPSGI
jgi:O-antigen ligase